MAKTQDKQVVHKECRLRPGREGLGIFSYGNLSIFGRQWGGQRIINNGMSFVKTFKGNVG